MGSGSYTSRDFISYSTSMGRSYDYSTKKLSKSTTHQDIFKARSVDPMLNPYKITRECCDSEEHPNTKPIILALDVTGSMGDAATEVASSLNKIMEDLYEKVEDIQFMTMGIGDFAYDRAPLQVSQFESDIRIVEQLDKMWFEFGGGGNSFESYTAAWKFALDHTKLDCFDKRGQKATIITMGDEKINPYINGDRWKEVVGDSIQGDIETEELFKEVSKKFNIYHINVDHHSYGYEDSAESFKRFLSPQHVFECKVDNIDETITDIILDSIKNTDISSTETIPQAIVNNTVEKNEEGEIVW